ncbi:MAG: thioredoxin domain-containing protein, partial [Rhodospirillales bacterium]
LAMLGEHGGWPLTMFLTPDAKPFWGGTYFPPAPRYGRPGFPDILRAIAKTFDEGRDRIEQNVTALMGGLEGIAKTNGGEGLSRERLDEVADLALGLVDPMHGGTKGAPKFPQPTFFRFLWRGYKRTGSQLYREPVLLTLNKICQGGIYDHLGGGFARYSTDPIWLAPHFEKMLYDNAQLIELLTEAWQETASPLYAARVRETVAWTLREMRVEGGKDGVFAFASAYDADSEGEEGKFYVWSETEIDDILGEDSAAFKGAYDVTPYGNWEGKNILNRTKKPGFGDAAYEDALAASREKLLAVRNRRVWPSWDDKVLADWNGLMIAALAGAGAAFGESAWIDAARAAFSFVVANMSGHMGGSGRLFHAWRAGQARHPAVIDDYANMSRAALILYEVTGEAAYLQHARDWAASADTHHWDPIEGGYFLPADDTADLIVRAKTVHDNATPAGNGVMVEVLARLFYLTGEDAYRRRAEDVVRAFCGQDVRPLMAMPSLLAGYELLESAVQTVIVSPGGKSSPQELIEAAFAAPAPNRIVLQVGPRASLPPGHPAAGKPAKDGKPTAYVCIGTTCGLPVTDAKELRAAMTDL